MVVLNNYMNLNHLRFINWDAILFSDPIDYIGLQKIINNQVQYMENCRETGLQLHLYQLINIIDSFFNPDRIVDVITLKHQAFSDDQLNEIQKKATELRILIECEKLYANQHWINSKREWVVEIRILASLLRVYRFLKMVWEFFVGDYPNIQTKSKTHKIILPLSKLEPFVDDVFNKLQKIQMCYYLNQSPYLVDIHVMFKAWRNLLVNFPTITRKEVITEFNLKLIILAQNQKYKNVYRERMLSVPQSPLRINKKIEEEKERQKQQEREHEKRINGNAKRSKSLNESALWTNKIVNFKLKSKKSKSVEKILMFCKQRKRLTVRFPFQPILLTRRSKNNSHFLKQRTNSSCTSIRNGSESKSILPSKLSTTDQFTVDNISSRLIRSPRQTAIARETMSPTRIHKPRSRRIQFTSDVVRLIPETNPILKSNDFQRHMKQKQPIQYTFTKHHQIQLRQQKLSMKSNLIKLNNIEIEITQTKIIKSSQQLEFQIDRILYSQQVSAPLRPKPNRYFKRRNQQQI